MNIEPMSTGKSDSFWMLSSAYKYQVEHYMDKGQDISANQKDYEDLPKAVDCLQTESLTVLISSATGSLILKPGAKALPK